MTFAGGSAVFLGACGGAAKSPREEELAKADAEILNSAIDLENMAIALYTAAGPLLRDVPLRLSKAFLLQEKEHEDKLFQEVMALGGRPHPPKSSYDFPTMKTPADVYRVADALENVAVRAYVDAIPKLSAGKLRALVGSILTTEAEHSSVLLGLMGSPQAPAALVTGKA